MRGPPSLAERSAQQSETGLEFARRYWLAASHRYIQLRAALPVLRGLLFCRRLCQLENVQTAPVFLALVRPRRLAVPAASAALSLAVSFCRPRRDRSACAAQDTNVVDTKAFRLCCLVALDSC